MGARTHTHTHTHTEHKKKDFLYFTDWKVRFKTVKMSILPKVIYRIKCLINAFSMKIPMAFFTETGKNSKLHLDG
jgi:hypothetical protein